MATGKVKLFSNNKLEKSTAASEPQKDRNTDQNNEDPDVIWEQNRQFFLEHEEEFKEKYPGLYVAVHKGEILGTGEKLGPLAGRIYEQYGNVPIFASIPGQKRTINLDLPIVC